MMITPAGLAIRHKENRAIAHPGWHQVDLDQPEQWSKQLGISKARQPNPRQQFFVDGLESDVACNHVSWAVCS